MQASDRPGWTPRRFAQSATGPYVRAIPQTTADPAAASFDIGFPPQTFTDEGAGGTPPDGRDFNGIFNYLSAWAQWVGLGGPVPYNSAVSTAGGYPKGARVQSATSAFRIWVSTVDNNTTNPDTAGAGWVCDVSTTYSDFTSAGSGNVTVPAWATHAEIAIVGGGGGGNGAGSSTSGGGGGAGGYSFGVINVTPGASLAYVVGAGGTGTTGSGTGGVGGQSSLGSFVAFGGFGSNNPSAGGFGGTANNTGLRGFTGGDGGDGNTLNRQVQGGNGAPGPFGGGGRTGLPNGENGRAAGAGGGAGWGTVGGKGGDGAAGAVLIRWLL